MSDTLKDRLNSHSNAFEGLLSLIPAKYYYDDDSKNQWKKKQQSKADSRQLKKAKFDPDAAGRSALDESKRRISNSSDARPPMTKGSRAEVEASNSQSEPIDDSNDLHDTNNNIEYSGDDSDDETTIVFDDKGNQISGPSDELPESFAGNSELKRQLDTKNDNQSTQKRSKKSTDNNGSSKAKSENGIDASEANSPDTLASKPKEASQTKQVPAGIEVLREKLAARINELKAQRKAPGSAAAGAPRNREELLAARQRRKEARSQSKTTAKSRDVPTQETDILEDIIPENNNGDSSVMFGQIKFEDGSRLDKKGESIEQDKKRKKRSAQDQLKVIESRKAKIDQLDDGKRETIKENANWSKAILQSEGARVRDDEKLLKKAVKQKQKRKLKSEKEWKARIAAVAHGKATREAKRNANIEARKEAKSAKKPAKKIKSSYKGKSKKARAGFEGKR